MILAPIFRAIFILMLPLKWEQLLAEFIYSFDNSKSLDNIFISNRDGGEESRIAERQRERECVWEAVRGWKGEITSVKKWAVREIHVVQL